jgi:hypothetical protein
MTEKQQNDEWYTEEDVDSTLGWNKLKEEYTNVQPILLAFLGVS